MPVLPSHRTRAEYGLFENDKRNFRVFIYEDELSEIKKWVMMKDHIETGGDLFGLWIDSQTAVVQFVLGPGQKCRRTVTSFYQDIAYLEEAGTYLTRRHGLCNIGQWHSHHRMSIPRPSGGDEHTVWSNMPTLGLPRYIVFIATINDDNTPSVNCFLFETNEDGQEHHPVLQGTLEILKGQGLSPFRMNQKLVQTVEKGAEQRSEIKLRGLKRKVDSRYGDQECDDMSKTASLDLVPKKVLTVQAGGESQCIERDEFVVVNLIPT